MTDKALDQQSSQLTPQPTGSDATTGKIVSGINEYTMEDISNQVGRTGRIKHEINLFKQVTGDYPESISELVNSGFLLYWPKNLKNNQPANVITSREIIPCTEDFGAFKYHIDSDISIGLDFSGFDYELRNSTGEQKWAKNTISFEEFTKYRHIDVIQGDFAVYEIEDPDVRWLYSMCGSLIALCDYQLGYYIADHGSPPASFDDLLGSSFFIIKENFDDFAKLLKDSGAVFKYGFDREAEKTYGILEIDGTRYISYCLRVDPQSIQEEIAHKDCHLEELDMSSSIITQDNIGDLKISPENLISIKDLHLSD